MRTRILPRLTQVFATGILATLVAAAGSVTARANSLTSAVQEKDLALVFEATSPQLIAGGEQRSGVRKVLLPQSWVSAVSNAYGDTSVGQSLEIENEYGDWKLVAARFVPCSPLGQTPRQSLGNLCWPEIRLVWQPILRSFPHMGRILPAYADDRAIHALYDVSPTFALTGQESTRAAALIDRIKAALARVPSVGTGIGEGGLNAAQLAEFERLRNKVSVHFLNAVVSLRTGGFAPNAYANIDVRPETLKNPTATLFAEKLESFLQVWAAPEMLKALTSFSLPEGRQPPLLDEWIFLSFAAKNATLTQENIVLKSAKDGRTLFDFGKSPRGTMNRDADDLYTALDAGEVNATDAAEIQASVLLYTTSKATLGAAIADRAQRLVPNTSCASCHKLNAERFDFHNLSYLENRSVTVSPRVQVDVRHDLNWILSTLNGTNR